MACTSASIAVPACSATFSTCEIQVLKSWRCMYSLTQSLLSSAPCVGWTSSPWAACGSPGWAGAGPCSDRKSAQHALRVSLHDRVMQYMRNIACCYAALAQAAFEYLRSSAWEHECKVTPASACMLLTQPHPPVSLLCKLKRPQAGPSHQGRKDAQASRAATWLQEACPA